MDRREFLHVTSSLAAVSLTGRMVAQDIGQTTRKAITDLSELLEATRKEYDLPGLAAAAMRGDGLVAHGVAGVRHVSKDARIAVHDRFAIGSCTKLMTGLLIARLIDAGKLSFDTKLAEALPAVKMADDYRDVTVAQVLAFTGGIQPYTQITPATTPILFVTDGTPTERRLRFIEHVLNEPPVGKVGTRVYSNAGYAVLGQIAAVRHDTDFEEAMRQQVFTPLGLERTGFGRPCTPERPNEPWQHVRRGKSFEPFPDRERPVDAVLAAAGDVHCSIHDLVKLAAYELLAAQGKDPHLKPATAKRRQELTNPTGQDDFAAFGGTPWLSAGVNYVKSQNLAIAFAMNAGTMDNSGRSVLKAVRQRVAGQ